MTNRNALAVALAGMLAAAIGSCADSNPPPQVCSTDNAWLDGDSGDKLMRPGGNCIGCHSDEGGPDT